MRVMDSGLNLAVVMPFYNEEQNVRSVVGEWLEALVACRMKAVLLAVDDGSRDNTFPSLEVLAKKNEGRLLVFHKTNSGHGRSCRFGYEKAISLGAEWVMQVDSDGQCDPRYFAEFWTSREGTDCVFGRRVSRGDGLARSMTSKMCRLAAGLVVGFDPGDANVPYRLMRREALVDALERVPADFDIHNVALTVALRQNPKWRWKWVPIHFRARQGGENSINLRKVAKMGLGMLRDLKRIKRSSSS